MIIKELIKLLQRKKQQDLPKLAQQAKKAANEGKLIKLDPSNDFPKSMDILKQSLSKTTSDNLYSELKSYGNKGPLAYNFLDDVKE